ncbi:Uncharacterized protein PHSC3_000608 [Chlamydiales bacterium STE3]|nr:Uncharacterized protein PHSC3_000608 [Chlamydiales bacterium STE3]
MASSDAATVTPAADAAYIFEGMGVFPQVELSPERSVFLTIDVSNGQVTDIKLDDRSRVMKSRNYPVNGTFQNSQNFNIQQIYPIASQGGRLIKLQSQPMPNRYSHVGWGDYLEKAHYIKGMGPIVLGIRSSSESLQKIEQSSAQLIYEGDLKTDSGSLGKVTINIDLPSHQFSGALALQDNGTFEIQGDFEKLEERINGNIKESEKAIGQISLLLYGNSNPEMGGIFRLEDKTLGKVQGIIALKKME